MHDNCRCSRIAGLFEATCRASAASASDQPPSIVLPDPRRRGRVTAVILGRSRCAAISARPRVKLYSPFTSPGGGNCFCHRPDRPPSIWFYDVGMCL